MKEFWNSKSAFTKFILVVGGVLILNILSSFIHGFIDLTSDKRFTLTKPTVQLLESVDENILVKVYLDGELPAGFKRLQGAVNELLVDFQGKNSKIQYIFEDPTVGTKEEIKNRRDQLVKDGLVPTSLKYSDGGKLVQKAIFPFAVLSRGQNKVKVNLLEEQGVGDDDEVILNNSISLLEYKMANGLQKLMLSKKQTIVFTEGNKEVTKEYTFRLEREMHKFYNTGRVNLDSLVYIDTLVDLLVVAAPQTALDAKNKFKIDQYIMNGGKVLWLIEKLDAGLDSIAKHKIYVPRDIDSGVDDILFKYGARVNPNLIMDLECTQIPQIVGMAGDKPQTMMFPWYYSPAIASKSNHPIVKNIDRVFMTFPSSIDTVKTAVPIKKTILLSSSNYSKVQFNPVRLTFELLKVEPDPKSFNNGNQAVAVLLEGAFQSAFTNRVSTEAQETLNKIGLKFKENGVTTRQIVVSDVDFAKNLINSRTNETEEIGYNRWEFKYYKGNKDFILNCVEYLLDKNNVLSARSKEVKLRMLNVIKLKEERTKWQLINLALPLAFLALFGAAYVYWRKRKYAH